MAFPSMHAKKVLLKELPHESIKTKRNFLMRFYIFTSIRISRRVSLLSWCMLHRLLHSHESDAQHRRLSSVENWALDATTSSTKSFHHQHSLETSFFCVITLLLVPAGLRNEKEREAAAEKGKNDFRVNIQSMNSDSHAPNDLSINDFLSFFIFSW